MNYPLSTQVITLWKKSEVSEKWRILSTEWFVVGILPFCCPFYPSCPICWSAFKTWQYHSVINNSLTLMITTPTSPFFLSPPFPVFPSSFFSPFFFPLSSSCLLFLYVNPRGSASLENPKLWIIYRGIKNSFSIGTNVKLSSAVFSELIKPLVTIKCRNASSPLRFGWT